VRRTRACGAWLPTSPRCTATSRRCTSSTRARTGSSGWTRRIAPRASSPSFASLGRDGRSCSSRTSRRCRGTATASASRWVGGGVRC
jgi:hypothetical protein